MSSGTFLYDWTKPEEHILIDMIQADNPRVALDYTMMTFGKPEELIIDESTGRTHNTKVLVSATATSKFYGDQFHYYHRVDINEFIYEGITNLNFNISEHGTLEHLVHALNERLGINLRPDMVVVDIPTHTDSALVVKIHDDSLCYYGELIIRYVGIHMELSDAITRVDLTGFNRVAGPQDLVNKFVGFELDGWDVNFDDSLIDPVDEIIEETELDGFDINFDSEFIYKSLIDDITERELDG